MSDRSCVSLLHDGALVVCADDRLLPIVEPWLPLHAVGIDATATRDARARVDVDVATDAFGAAPTHAAVADAASPLLLFAGVRAHALDPDTIALRGGSSVVGEIALGDRQARIAAPVVRDATPTESRTSGEVYSMLTLCAAFLVGRLGGALVHAGAVVDPDGRAWLLVGDTHAGKTTTCVSLVDAGWSFLADDQVVLRREASAIVAEGWPRHAHLDEGWSQSIVTGRRATLDLRARWGARWRQRAPLGGLLFPNVVADTPTATAPIHSATAFAALVRQSPWLMADRTAAAGVMDLLRDACGGPAFALSLGRDGYARGDVVAERLGPALSAADAAS